MGSYTAGGTGLNRTGLFRLRIGWIRGCGGRESRPFTREFAAQPCLGLFPVAPNSAFVDSQCSGGLLFTVSGEEAAFDHLSEPDIQ